MQLVLSAVELPVAWWASDGNVITQYGSMRARGWMFLGVVV